MAAIFQEIVSMKMSIVNTGQTLVNVKLIPVTCLNTARKAVVFAKNNSMDKLGEHCHKLNKVLPSSCRTNFKKIVRPTLLQTFQPIEYLNLLLETMNSVLSDKSIKLNKFY